MIYPCLCCPINTWAYSSSKRFAISVTLTLSEVKYCNQAAPYSIIFLILLLSNNACWAAFSEKSIWSKIPCSDWSISMLINRILPQFEACWPASVLSTQTMFFHHWKEIQASTELSHVQSDFLSSGLYLSRWSAWTILPKSFGFGISPISSNTSKPSLWVNAVCSKALLVLRQVW